MAVSRTRRASLPLPRPGSLAVAGRVSLRTWPSVLAGVTALGIVVGTAWNVGGYFPPAYLAAGVVAYAVLAVVLVLRPPHYSVSTHALVALAALALFAVWTGLSARWSPAPSTAMLEMQRNLAYVGIFGLAIVAAGSGRLTRQLLWATMLTMLGIVVAGLLSRLYPHLIHDPIATQGADEYRLGYPFGYWNAYGVIAAMGAVLALGLAADPRSAVVLRALAAGSSVTMATAMYLSLSRGAWLALVAGVIALAVLGAQRGSLLLSAGLVGALAALAIARAHGYPALFDDPAQPPGQIASGREFGPQLLGLVAIAVLVQGVVAAGRASPNLMQAMRRVVRPLLLGSVISVGLILAAIYVIKTSAVERRTANVLVGVNAWADRQWTDFNRPTTIAPTGSARLSSAKGTRSDQYRVALDGLDAHPLRGDGAGGFEIRWFRERRVDETVRNAHSLYHETLGDLGLVGFGLLALFIGAVVLAAVRARLRPGALSRPQAAAVGASLVVWLVHNGFDWDWEMVAVTAPGLILAAVLLPYGRRTSSSAVGGPARQGSGTADLRPGSC